MLTDPAQQQARENVRKKLEEAGLQREVHYRIVDRNGNRVFQFKAGLFGTLPVSWYEAYNSVLRYNTGKDAWGKTTWVVKTIKIETLIDSVRRKLPG